jgi:hypothetical protein
LAEKGLSVKSFSGEMMKISGISILVYVFFLSLLLSTPFVSQVRAGVKAKILKFSSVYEPSAVIFVAPDSFLIFEDDGKKPIVHLLLQKDSKSPQLEEKKRYSFSTRVKDLEGAVVAGGIDAAQIYAITSHSSDKDDKAQADREKLLKFSFVANTISEEKQAENLRSPLTSLLDQRDDLSAGQAQAINIEALSTTPDGKKLLLGLRSPTVGGQALLVVLENPDEVVGLGAKPEFSKEIVSFDLGGGFRAITFDEVSGHYLFASEAKNKKGKLRPALWKWDGRVGHPAEPIKLSKIKGVKNIEGMTFFSYRNKDYLLLVCDDGDKKKKSGAHYLIIDKKDLTLQ